VYNSPGTRKPCGDTSPKIQHWLQCMLSALLRFNNFTISSAKHYRYYHLKEKHMNISMSLFTPWCSSGSTLVPLMAPKCCPCSSTYLKRKICFGKWNFFWKNNSYEVCIWCYTGSYFSDEWKRSFITFYSFV